MVAPSIAAIPLESAVWAALQDVHDPEIPTISVVDLGVIGGVRTEEGRISVDLLPTFVGCPALDIIRSTIVERLEARFKLPVRVEPTFEVPWTSDRISDAGRAALLGAGIAPPAPSSAMRCPFCASADVVMDSAFGPTQCRSLFYCRGCRQPFEALKSV